MFKGIGRDKKEKSGTKSQEVRENRSFYFFCVAAEELIHFYFLESVSAQFCCSILVKQDNADSGKIAELENLFSLPRRNTCSKNNNSLMTVTPTSYFQ